MLFSKIVKVHIAFTLSAHTSHRQEFEKEKLKNIKLDLAFKPKIITQKQCAT